jgi:hypothetical protein
MVLSPGRKPGVKWDKYLSHGVATPLATQSLQAVRKRCKNHSGFSRWGKLPKELQRRQDDVGITSL